MKKLVCTQCGAKIDPNSMLCEYCGSAYVNITAQPATVVTEEAKTNKKNKPNITDDFLVELLNSTCKENKFSKNLFPILFMIFWIMICVFISVSFSGLGLSQEFGFSQGFNIFRIVPIGFAVFGIIVTISIIKKSIPFKITDCIELIKQKRYEEAFGWLKSKNDANNNKNYIFAMIILCYYRLNDEDLVHLLYTKLTYYDVATVSFKNSVISTIATELNVTLPNNHVTN